MRHTKATEQIQETAALYALGALTQQEVRSFEFHLLEGCPVCQTLAKHFEKIATGLGYAASEVEPASYVRDVLAVRIEHELRTPGADSASKVEESTPNQADDFAFHLFPAGPPRSRRNLFLGVLAVFLAVSTAFFLYMWRTTDRRLDQALSSERESSVAIRDQATRAESLPKSEEAKPREIDQISMALSGPGTETFLLTSQRTENLYTVILFWNQQKNRGVVIGRLPPAPAGKDYQLWLMAPPDSKISEGLLEPDSTGRCFSVVDMPPASTKITTAAITVEPKGGSEQPTTRAFALSK